MTYDISSVSNRDIQLLYKYRILREPSDLLTAICRGGEPVRTSIGNWISDDDAYSATISTTVESDCVPFIEFCTDSEEDWKWICDFIDVSVGVSGLTIRSASNHLSGLPVSIYWCYSLAQIGSLLEGILDDIGRLESEYDKLENDIKNFRDNGRYLKRPEGLIPNLVRIKKSDDQNDLVDSLYQIKTAESRRLFVDYSQAMLNEMSHTFNQSVEFRFTNQGHYVIESFTTPLLLVSGKGDLVLRNIQGQVLLTKWSGTITVMDCPDVHVSAESPSDICKVSDFLITKNSIVYLENYLHEIKKITLQANSICRHWRSTVETLDYVGPGCAYWCSAQVNTPGRIQLPQLEGYNTVFDFNVHDIIGTFISEFKDILILGQRNLTARIGNSDPDPDNTLYVQKWVAQYTRYGNGGVSPGGTPGGAPGTTIPVDVNPDGTIIAEGDMRSVPLPEVLPRGWYKNTKASTSGIAGYYSNGQRTYIVFTQGSAPWNDYKYWEGYMPGEACGPVSNATITTGFGIDITPPTTADMVHRLLGWEPNTIHKGDKSAGSNALQTKVFTQNGLSCNEISGTDRDAIRAHMKKGYPVQINVCGEDGGYWNYGPRETKGHYIALLDYDEASDRVFIGDPAGQSNCGWYPLAGCTTPKHVNDAMLVER